MEITRTSIATGVTRTRDIPVTQEQLERWQKGGLIQDVMPELSDEDREFVQSGMTAAEWQEMELNDGPDIVELGTWTLGDDGRETRLIIGQDLVFGNARRRFLQCNAEVRTIEPPDVLRKLTINRPADFGDAALHRRLDLFTQPCQPSDDRLKAFRNLFQPDGQRSHLPGLTVTRQNGVQGRAEKPSSFAQFHRSEALLHRFCSAALNSPGSVEEIQRRGFDRLSGEIAGDVDPHVFLRDDPGIVQWPPLRHFGSLCSIADDHV
jgi:hypothetical protein